MTRSGKIERRDGIRCIECGDVIEPCHSYHIIKRSRYFGGKYVHIHKNCYEALLPENKSKKEVIL